MAQRTRAACLVRARGPRHHPTAARAPDHGNAVCRGLHGIFAPAHRTSLAPQPGRASRCGDANSPGHSRTRVQAPPARTGAAAHHRSAAPGAFFRWPGLSLHRQHAGPLHFAAHGAAVRRSRRHGQPRRHGCLHHARPHQRRLPARGQRLFSLPLVPPRHPRADGRQSGLCAPLRPLRLADWHGRLPVRVGNTAEKRSHAAPARPALWCQWFGGADRRGWPLTAQPQQPGAGGLAARTNA